MSILWPAMNATKFYKAHLNIHIQGSFKTCSLLFSSAEIIFVVVWPLFQFVLKSTPSVIDAWIITFVSHLNAWVTKPKPLLMFLKLPVLISSGVVWVNFSNVLFDETQHVVKTSTASHVLVCYEVICLFIELQNLLFMKFICTACRGLSWLEMTC